MFKVLISDDMHEAALEIFKEYEDITVDVNTGLPAEELIKIIGDYNGLAIRSATKVTADVLAAAKNLKVIARAGVGLDNVDIEKATEQGVAVMNTPGQNTVTTAEHTIAMMLSMTRNIPRATASLKDGKWDKKLLQGREVFNKTLGVIGFGNIGSIVADRARGLKMKPIVHDPYIPAEQVEKQGFEFVTLEELYARSDYVTMHIPKLDTTANLINAQTIAKMKKGVMIINCARGGLIDEKALYDAIVSGHVSGAAIDVFAQEPPEDNPLLTLDQVTASPHLGASTKEAQINVAVAAARQIGDYLVKNQAVNAVNL